MTMTDEPTTEPERAPLEVVSREVATRDTPATDHTGGALDRAAEVALTTPDMPGRDEFLTLAASARILSMSGAAPKLVKGNPYIAFHLALVGRDLGISPSAALALIDVIDTGQGPQLSLSPQLLNGQIRRIGAGEILKKISTASECVATAVGPRGIDQRCRLTWRNDVHAEGCGCDILGEVEFTWEDAQMAGLAGSECTPGDHKKRQMTRANNSTYMACGCNSGYEKYPKRMMWWRASGFCADDYFPEASLGMYSPDALGAIVDQDGRAIDPATVEVPDGYEPALPPPPERSDPAELWNLQMRIGALPDDERAALLERWNAAEKLKGWKPFALDPGQLRLAGSLVSAVESQARTRTKSEWQAGPAHERASRTVYGHLAALLGLHPNAATPEPEPPTDRHEASPEQREGEATPADAQPEPATVHEAHVGYADEPDLDSMGPIPAAEMDRAIADVGQLDARHVDKELTRLRMHSEGEIAERRRRLVAGLLRERLSPPTQETILESGLAPEPDQQ